MLRIAHCLDNRLTDGGEVLTVQGNVCHACHSCPSRPTARHGNKSIYPSVLVKEYVTSCGFYRRPRWQHCPTVSTQQQTKPKLVMALAYRIMYVCTKDHKAIQMHAIKWPRFAIMVFINDLQSN
jgi:hypothetical protein